MERGVCVGSAKRKKEFRAMASKKKKLNLHLNLSLDTKTHTPTSRPKNINEIAHQEEVVKALNRSLETANVRVVFFMKARREKREKDIHRSRGEDSVLNSTSQL